MEDLIPQEELLGSKEYKTEDLLSEENALTKKMFDLDEILSFQLEHDVQIIRGEDYQYMCFIDKECYTADLTPMFALVYGIKRFKEFEAKNKQNIEN